MATLTSNDILVRLQRLGCCIGTKGSDTANAAFIGKGCAAEHLRELTLLSVMLEILQDFKPTTTAVGASATITLAAGTSGTTTIKVNGITLNTGGTAFTASLTATATAIAAAINSTASTPIDYSATSLGAVLTITGPTAYGDYLNGDVFTITTTGDMTFTSTAFSGGVKGVTESTRCLSDTEAQVMFEYMAKACDLCFLPVGTTYISYAASLPSSRIALESSVASSPSFLLMEDGSRLLLE